MADLFVFLTKTQSILTESNLPVIFHVSSRGDIKHWTEKYGLIPSNDSRAALPVGQTAAM